MGERRDLIVIGGGAGGLVVASVAGQLGLRVTLIEKEHALGGDCLHHGCVPSKSLIKAAKVAHWMRRGIEFGLPAVPFEVDLAAVNARVGAIVEQIQQHDDPERFRGYGCEVIFGAARFVDPHTVQVNDRRLSGRRFVIATGSQPAIPPIEGLETAGYVTNRDVFSLENLPPRLAVLGGGPVGLELAQAFARLGSEVTVVERLAHILAQEDPEIADALHAQLTSEGVTLHTSTNVERVRQASGHRIVVCSNNRQIEAEQILVATGRRATVDKLGLEAAGVDFSAQGIGVDRRMRTSQKHIYACGDVCGPYPFTHMAEYQAGVVISNAIFRFPKKADYRAVPWVTYTDPELARVGLTEQQATEQGLKPAVLRFDFKDVDRAVTERQAVGRVKLISRKGRILGASILGPQAGELIHEIVLAMHSGAKLGDISAAIHAYPTLSQVHRRTVNTAYAPKLFSPMSRRLVRWLQRLPG